MTGSFFYFGYPQMSQSTAVGSKEICELEGLKKSPDRSISTDQEVRKIEQEPRVSVQARSSFNCARSAKAGNPTNR